MTCLLIGIVVWVAAGVFVWSLCRASAIGDRLNREMHEYNRKVGFRWPK